MQGGGKKIGWELAFIVYRSVQFGNGALFYPVTA